MAQTSRGWAGPASAAAIVAAVALVAYFALPRRAGEPPVSASAPVVAPTPAAATPAPAHYPIENVATPAATESPEPAPALDGSDAAVLAALSTLVGGEGLDALLYPEHVIPRVVAAIDSLPRPQVSPQVMPLRPAPGSFVVAGAADRRTIDAGNAARYAAYMKLVQAADTKALVAWYRKSYPLFQQAYRELGYPDGYFNDRLVVVIDDLLATPDVAGPIALAQPNVLYEFADPALQARSAGQKILLRAGPENAAIVKAKLREIRRELTGKTGA